MRIIQMIPSLLYGDAMGNDVLALDGFLKRMGYKSEIYAETIAKRIPKGRAKPISLWQEPDQDDVIIYHLGTYWSFIEKIKGYSCRKILIYHNITPSNFFKNYDDTAFETCSRAIEQAKSFSNTFDYCLAVSTFNKMDLISYGYKCPIDVLPILIPYNDYKQKPNSEVLKKYKIRGSNILFVGRIVPNKCYEDIVGIFFLYKKYFDPYARLFLVGSFDESGLYYRRLKTYIDVLGVEDVIIPGHISFDEILAYYTLADAFLCMSEHEGFCVPLVEAMLFKIPIIAYDKCAVGDTLQDGGILLKNKDYAEAAGILNKIVHDSKLRSNIIRNQKRRLDDLKTEKVEKLFEEYLKTFLEK